MSGEASLPRPLRKTEYEVFLTNSGAEKGWRDMLATARNATVEAWEQLTADPEEQSARQYPLKGDLGTGTYKGQAYVRWRYKLTDGGRLWYFVAGRARASTPAGCSSTRSPRAIPRAANGCAAAGADTPRHWPHGAGLQAE